MARTLAELPKGCRITDHISLGVIAKTFPLGTIKEILERTGKTSKRERDLPAHVVVYYIIVLALYMQSSYREVLRCLLEGIQWLKSPAIKVNVTGKSGISQARSRLGFLPLKQLHDEVVRPIGGRQTRGAWYRDWRLISMDGSTLDVADTESNRKVFGKPKASRGQTAYPQVRFVSLVENGTHVLFGTQMDSHDTGEAPLAEAAIEHLERGFLCLADRYFYGFELWRKAHSTGADLLWRIKKNIVLPDEKRLRDGSYLSRIYPSVKKRRHKAEGVPVRVIEYRLDGLEGSDEIYRLMTTILDPDKAPAKELAALYHERWEIETAFDELKTHLRGPRIVLRSKTSDLVRQEFYGLVLAHFAVRALMHEAALMGDVDPDRLSFVHSVRLIRRKIPFFPAIPPGGAKSVS